MNTIHSFWNNGAEVEVPPTQSTIIPVKEEFHSDGAPIAEGTNDSPPPRGNAINELNTQPTTALEEEAANLANPTVEEKPRLDGLDVVDVITGEGDENKKPAEASGEGTPAGESEESEEGQPAIATAEVGKASESTVEVTIGFDQLKENVAAKIISTEHKIRELQAKLENAKNKVARDIEEKNKMITESDNNIRQMAERIAILEAQKNGFKGIQDLYEQMEASDEEVKD